MSQSKNLKVLALIPARGGSKGLPRKNILPAGGVPLIGWTIKAANSADIISQVIVSSDDDDIINVAREYGAGIPFKRPNELATDSATSLDVVLHALNYFPGYDYLVLLQPTSPLRQASDIDGAFQTMLRAGASSCVSVCEASESPYWMYNLTDSGCLQNVVSSSKSVDRRQDLPAAYVLNGAIYIAQIDWLRKKQTFINKDTVAYIMPRSRSIDIDTKEDFLIFKNLVEN